MSVGPDIKEVFEEVGISVTLLRVPEVTDEYLYYHLNRQVTKPFIREFFVEAFFPYDSPIVAGELVRFDFSGDVYMVMNKTPQVFENEIVQYHSVMYKCNVSGELQRVSGETWNDVYRMEPVYETIKSMAYGLQTEALYGHDLESNEELGQIGLENHELYLPTNYGARVLDRYIPYSGETPYKVHTMKTRRFPAVIVAEVEKDTR